MIVIGSNTSDNGQPRFTEDVPASLKTSRTLWNSDRIGSSLNKAICQKVYTQLRIQGGGQGGHGPPPLSLLKLVIKKDGRHRRPLIFHVSCPPPPLTLLDPMLTLTHHSPISLIPDSQGTEHESARHQLQCKLNYLSAVTENITKRNLSNVFQYISVFKI